MPNFVQQFQTWHTTTNELQFHKKVSIKRSQLALRISHFQQLNIKIKYTWRLREGGSDKCEQIYSQTLQRRSHRAGIIFIIIDHTKKRAQDKSFETDLNQELEINIIKGLNGMFWIWSIKVYKDWIAFFLLKQYQVFNRENHMAS